MSPKGLSALIPTSEQQKRAPSLSQAIGKSETVESRQQILQIPLGKIHPNARQPRVFFDPQRMKDLVESIRQYGMLQPLVVTSHPDGGYEIVAGERRLRAAHDLGLKTVPAILREAKELERLELALIENIQREDLNPIERAAAYRKLLDEFGLTQEEAAKRLAKPRTVIANTLRLLDLPPEIQRAIGRGEISEGHGKVLAGLPTPAAQTTTYRKILVGDLSVRETEDLLTNVSAHGGARRRARQQSPWKEEQERLQEHLSTRVDVRQKGKGGRIVIHFSSLEELRRLVRVILR